MTRRLVAIACVLAFVVLGLWSLRPESDRFDPGSDERAPIESVAAVPTELDVVDATPATRVETTIPTPIVAARVIAEVTQGVAAEPETTLTVRVVSLQTHEPIAGAHVVAREAIGGFDGVTILHGRARGTVGDGLTTDARGEVIFACEPHRAIDLHTDGTDVAWVEEHVFGLARGEHRVVELRVATGNDRIFWGRLVADGSLAPIAAASIDLREEGEPPRTAQTDASGRFQFPCSSWTNPSFRIRADGFAPAIGCAIEGHAAPVDALEIVLSRAASLEVRVLGARNATSVDLDVHVRDLTITPAPPFPWIDEGTAWKELADDAGVARFAALPPRVPLTLVVRSGAQVLRRDENALVLDPGETRRIDIALDTGTRVLGRMLDEKGEAVGGREVWLVAARTKTQRFFDKYADDPMATSRTNALGEFEISGARAGAWWIGGSPPDLGEPLPPTDWRARFVEIPEGVPSVRVDLVAYRGLFVSGKVVGPDDEPISGGYVSAIAEGTFDGIEADVEDGRFSLGPLPRGRFQLVATARGFAPSERLTCASGESELVLRLSRTAPFEGRVIDAASGLEVEAEVTYACPGTFTSWTRANASGRFAADAPAGIYTFTAATADGRVGVRRGVVLSAGASTADLLISVQAGARVRARYGGPREVAFVVLLSDGACVGQITAERETLVEVAVPPGRLVARWHVLSMDVAHEEAFEVAAGEVRDIAFESAK